MQVAMLGGDCHPATPIGINLPNAEWIRERYGSKSVTLDNITYAYDMAAKSSGMIDEFAGSDEEIRLAREWGTIGVMYIPIFTNVWVMGREKCCRV